MSTIEAPVVDPLELIPTLPEEPAPSRREVLLLKAAELIEQHGWRRYSLGDKDNGFCILGATGYVLGFYEGFKGCWMNPEDGHATVEMLCGDGPDYAGWNDMIEDDHWGHVRSIAALRRLADGATWEEAIA